MTIDGLRDAYLSLQRKAAPGVDGVMWDEYGQDLEIHLADLHAAFTVERIERSPRAAFASRNSMAFSTLVIAELEDKILQRAIVEVLNANYEVDFAGFSYGFRPGRRQHHAPDALTSGISRKKVNWVLDADVRGCFDAIDHGWMVKFVEHCIADRRVVRLIQNWLAAGPLEDGKWSRSEGGTPQGATISPLLANVYLHYVFDLWVQQ
jgi:RNA-directed DNA polymerase